jgi:lysine-specific histone demethylase 1
VLGQLKLDLHYLENAVTQTLLYNSEGEPVDPILDAESEKVFNFILDQCLKTLVVDNKLLVLEDRHSLDIMALEGAEQVPSLGKMFDHYLKQHLKHNHLNSDQLELIHWHLANIEFSSSALLENLSLYHWDQDDPNAFDGTHSMVKGGYLQLPHSYAYGNQDIMPLDIRFEKNVISISTKTRPEDHIEDFDGAIGHIKIVCSDGSIYRCDGVVVTSSIGLLQVFLICNL